MHVQAVEEEVELRKGSRVRVLTAEGDKDKTDKTTIWVDYSSLPRVLEKGSKIYIDDGLIGLKVVEIGKPPLVLGGSTRWWWSRCGVAEVLPGLHGPSSVQGDEQQNH